MSSSLQKWELVVLCTCTCNMLIGFGVFFRNFENIITINLAELALRGTMSFWACYFWGKCNYNILMEPRRWLAFIIPGRKEYMYRDINYDDVL